MSLRAKSLERKAEQAVSAAEAAVASLQSLNKDYADFQAKAAKIAASEAAAVEKYERLAESSHKWQSLIRAHKDKELKQKKKIQALKKDNEDKNRLIEELLRKLPSQYSSYPSQHDRDIEGESDLDHSPAFSEDEGDEAASLIVDLDSVPTTPAPQRTFRQPLSPLVAESRPNRTSETRPQPPRFRSDWQLRQPEPKRRKANPEQPFNFPIDVDGKGRAKKTVRCGTKRKLTCA
ncbi:hypothetical protein GLOTRDRAFT_138073 [Gloeophyllum trabeum ATCC 11539]|uniref:Uncharacterized protein n=1 Tax=Gloeophyllum trabeum (strain ATCC 11539 / FP-39264 / Madison 617) TaxID=670483 RepID=S7QA99_GLOTA|nr:uncharacterized protein GLOTRDRAFT_138073 [Gloeophyllum trabeum ATCC 11539]EPQ56303.1 hypothetical protein GLOTRDRAFT_138073 [Gloeophyllum trabeum ATCC 11539]